MDVLRATNESDARHAEAVRVECFFRGGDERRVIGQTKVIIRAHIEDAATARNFDLRVLRAGDDSFGFVETLRPDFRKRVCELLIELRGHGEASNKVSAMQKSSIALRGMRTAPCHFLRLRSNDNDLAFSCARAAIRKEILLHGVVNNC